ncbi:hypothetical protein ACYJ2U_001616 [Clostridium botulinum]
MLSIKTKIKINQTQKKIKNKLDKILYYIFKPLIILEDKVLKYKRNKIYKSANNLTEETFIYLLVKNHIVKDLIKHPNGEICFEYEYNYDEENVLTYARGLKNNILKRWSYEFDFDDEKGTNIRLMELVKKELKTYPEIDFYDYQHNKYCSKILVIKLKE